MDAGMNYLLGLWIMAATVATAAPKIEFDRMEYDFGTTTLVESVTGKFVYKNTGDETLVIQPPSPSCGCTVAKMSASTLKPGESGELEFNVGLGYHEQRFNKGITVPSNDPKNPSAYLGIKVIVKQTFTSNPRGLAFSDLPVGASTNETVVLRRLDGIPVVVTKLEPSAPFLTATATSQTNGTALMAVSLTATGQPRRISEQVKVFTADAKGAAYSVFVTARLVGDVVIEPQAIGWGMPDLEHWNEADPDIILERVVRIECRKKDWKLEVRNPVCTIPGVKLAVEPGDDSGQFLLTASLDKPLTKAAQGMITVETNLESLPKLEIPIEINIWRK
jgi:hypothetical protein